MDRNHGVMETVRGCFQRALNLDGAAAAGIGAETTAADVAGWNSVGHLALVLELEQAFKVSFENDEIVSLGSVEAILAAIARKQG